MKYEFGSTNGKPKIPPIPKVSFHAFKQLVRPLKFSSKQANRTSESHAAGRPKHSRKHWFLVQKASTGRKKYIEMKKMLFRENFGLLVRIPVLSSWFKNIEISYRIGFIFHFLELQRWISWKKIIKKLWKSVNNGAQNSKTIIYLLRKC